MFQETGRPRELPGPLRAAPRVDRRRLCARGGRYRATLRERREQEAEQLASLTGWSVADIRKKIGLDGPAPAAERQWWERLWKK